MNLSEFTRSSQVKRPLADIMLLFLCIPGVVSIGSAQADTVSFPIATSAASISKHPLLSSPRYGSHPRSATPQRQHAFPGR